jgi:PPM family protein phosphatase
MDRLVFIFIAWEVVIEMFWSKKAKQARKTKRIYSDRLTVQSGSIKVNPSNYQHVGARENQEDAFAFSDLGDGELVATNGVLAILADGMGGLANGEQASQAAVNTFLREYNDKEENEAAAKFLLRAATVANAAVFDLAYNNGDEIELGTTLVAALINGNSMHTISVGDSRIYLYRGHKINQLTTDHIYANHLAGQVMKGTLSRKEAAEHPERNFLTSYLGLSRLAEVDCSEEPVCLESGDKVILCSDGLYDTIPENEIEAVLSVRHANYAEELVKITLEKNNPYQDNVTVIVLDILSS